MRVFLDANILFSASNPKWLTSLLLDVLELHGELVTSEFAAQEASEGSVPRIDAFFSRVSAVSTL